MKECIQCHRMKEEVAFEKSGKWIRNQCRECRKPKKLEWTRRYSKTPKGRAGQKIRHDKYRQSSKGKAVEQKYIQSPEHRYYACKFSHVKKYGIFDVDRDEYRTKYVMAKECGLCGLPFGVGHSKKVWEYDYKEFWHDSCNRFKSKMNKSEFHEFIRRIYDRLK